MNKILPRIQQIAEHEGITIGAIERTIGASKGVLSRAIANGTDIQSKWIQSLIENYPHYSAQWLLTGNGNMLNVHDDSSASQNVISTNEETESVSAFDKFTEGIRQSPGSIPLVSEQAVGGFFGKDFSIAKRDVLAYYVIPKFRFLSVDFMIEVIGDSMMPHIYPGDIVACSIIYNPQFIQWNKPHLIATLDQGLIIKRLRRSDKDGNLLAISDNNDYEPFDIPVSEIAGMARIVGVIHAE